MNLMMNRKSGRLHGEVFTNLEVVHYLLDEVGYQSNLNLEKVRILEPAAGTGIFAIEIINRLVQSATKFGFNFLDALNSNIALVEMKRESFEILKQKIKVSVQYLGYDSNKIKEQLFIHANFLKIDFSEKFDCVVGNPPYIRHEIIDVEAKKFYKKQFTTFKFRADIYVLFYEKSMKLLNNTGKLSFICSNRWLYNQYGQLLRKKIAEEFHLQKLVNIEKTTPFDEEVIAYPCISTIAKQKQQYTLYFETNSKKLDLKHLKFKKRQAPKNESWSNLFLDYDINQTALCSIVDQDFKIGIGVATGADKIFIKKAADINGIEKSRLIPILKSKALKGDKINWDNTYVINPFENGGLCDLENYPHLRDYFYTHRTVLEQRHIAKKNPKNWFKTIDKIKLELIKTPKLLLPDLSGGKFLYIDKGKFYPHHNVYYIIHQDIDRLKILACLLMSDFTKEQLSQIGIRMNGGLPRFQAQTLKKIRIPILDFFKITTIKELVAAYDDKDLLKINKIVNKYCIQQKIYQKQ